MLYLRIADLISESVVDGPGFRFTIFAQGCPHRCKGCHNPETHAAEGGRRISVLAVIRAINKAIDSLDGVTFSGGEPFCQPEPFAFIARWCKRKKLSVMCYSGFTYDRLATDLFVWRLLSEIDFLMDGPFVVSRRSLDLRFRGSENQRFIDLRKIRAGAALQQAIIT